VELRAGMKTSRIAMGNLLDRTNVGLACDFPS
jgi:hypothetical protein